MLSCSEIKLKLHFGGGCFLVLVCFNGGWVWSAWKPQLWIGWHTCKLPSCSFHVLSVNHFHYSEWLALSLVPSFWYSVFGGSMCAPIYTQAHICTHRCTHNIRSPAHTHTHAHTCTCINRYTLTCAQVHMNTSSHIESMRALVHT